jgi:hypothetical protein
MAIDLLGSIAGYIKPSMGGCSHETFLRRFAKMPNRLERVIDVTQATKKQHATKSNPRQGLGCGVGKFVASTCSPRQDTALTVLGKLQQLGRDQ